MATEIFEYAPEDYRRDVLKGFYTPPATKLEITIKRPLVLDDIQILDEALGVYQSKFSHKLQNMLESIDHHDIPRAELSACSMITDLRISLDVSFKGMKDQFDKGYVADLARFFVLSLQTANSLSNRR